jgi:hypothetical protein
MRFPLHPDEIPALLLVFQSSPVLVSLCAESRQFWLMIIASGDFDRDVFPYLDHLVQIPTEEHIQAILTFLLTGSQKISIMGDINNGGSPLMRT